MLRTLRIACALGLLCAWVPTPARADAPAGAGAAHAPLPPGVAWFDGSVGEAFAAAKSAHMPVLLYWAAVWCPFCQELRATVFRRRDFLDRLTLFVPVYLDGDDAGAQRWGEHFRISGYPTVLVLRADQSELERVSGGMDLTRYAQLLDLALAQGRSAQELLAAIDRGGARLDRDDCRRLAFNAWQLDDGWVFEPQSLGALADALRRAADRCPAPLRTERARLRLTALQAALASERGSIDAGGGASARLRSVLAAVPAVLADRALALATADALLLLPAEYFLAAGRLDPAHRSRLQAQWFALMDALAGDARYSAAEHLAAIGSKLVAARALDPAGRIAAPLAADAVRRIERALAQEQDPETRCALINAALNVLEVLGDDERAQALLAQEIKTAANAYYYMSDLADLEERRGHREAAIDWLARSYREAQGPATRFQWGVGYVRGLVRMQPQDEQAIGNAAAMVLAELEPDADLHGRTRRALERLDRALREWNARGAHDTVIVALRERMQAVCGKVPVQDPARTACEGFLRSA